MFRSLIVQMATNENGPCSTGKLYNTVQTLDLILLCTRCIPQMHFYIRSKIYLQLLPCLGNNFTKQGNLASSSKNIYTIPIKACQVLAQFSIHYGTMCTSGVIIPAVGDFFTLSLTPDAISLATRKRFTLSPFKQVRLV